MKRFSGLNRATIFSCMAISSLGSVQAHADNPGGWEYRVAPMYLWAKNIDGTASLGGMEAPLELGFKDDIFDNLDAAFAIHFEMTQGDLTLIAEYNYAKLDPSAEETIGPTTLTADIEFKDTMWELGVAYAFAHTESTSWEILGGVRYFDQEIDVDIGQGLLPDKISGGDDWWQGFGGFRMKTKISESWSFIGRLDVGYQDSHNKSGHAIGMFDYQFRDWGSFFAGYRYLDTDYSNGDAGPSEYAFVADQQGPVLGLNLYF